MTIEMPRLDADPSAVIRYGDALPGGQRISWLESGPSDGPPVLLLHGGGADNAELSWGPTIEVLSAAGYRAIAPDHPGFGHSPQSSAHDLTGLDLYLEAFTEMLELTDYDVVGSSMGGALALSHTLRAPERVRRLVLVATYGIQQGMAMHPWNAFWVQLPWVVDMAKMASLNPLYVSFSLASLLNKAPFDSDLVMQVREAALNTPALDTFNDFQRHELDWWNNKTDLSPQLCNITQRVLLIQGSADLILPVSDAQRATGLFPDARLEIFKGCGHWTQRDDPQRFHLSLLDFLQ